jgi:hypothetical protein
MVHLNMPALKQPVKPVRSVFFTPDRFFFDCSLVKIADMLADFTGKHLRPIQRKRSVGLCWKKIQKIPDS